LKTHLAGSDIRSAAATARSLSALSTAVPGSGVVDDASLRMRCSVLVYPAFRLDHTGLAGLAADNSTLWRKLMLSAEKKKVQF